MRRCAALGLALALALSGGTPSRAVQRVVSLNLCTDQFLALLAPEKIVGLSTLARDPALSYVAARAEMLPIVRASAEAVMALRPDLVLGARYGAGVTLALLERAGVRVARVDLPTDFPGIRAALRATATLLEIPDRAEPLIAAMDAALPPPGPHLRALVWEPRGWTAGPGGLWDAVLRAAGLTNAGAGTRVGLEALLRDPPAVLVLPEDAAGPSLATELLAHPAIRGIPVRTVPTSLTICPGPFAAGAVRRLTEVTAGSPAGSEY
jgi:iron complex transport system substrate-binding protein